MIADYLTAALVGVVWSVYLKWRPFPDGLVWLRRTIVSMLAKRDDDRCCPHKMSFEFSNVHSQHLFWHLLRNSLLLGIVEQHQEAADGLSRPCSSDGAIPYGRKCSLQSLISSEVLFHGSQLHRFHGNCKCDRCILSHLHTRFVPFIIFGTRIERVARETTTTTNWVWGQQVGHPQKADKRT